MYKEYFFNEMNKLKRVVIDGLVVSNEGQFGSTKIDKDMGAFNIHERKASESFLQWRFDDSNDKYAYTAITLLGIPKWHILKGRKGFEMIPIPVCNPKINKCVIVGAALDRFHYLFDKKSDKWYENLINTYKKMEIIK